MPNRALVLIGLFPVIAAVAPPAGFVDDFSVDADRLDRSVWTTEIGPGSFLGRTQLRDWVTEGQPGRFIATGGVAKLALDTFNPTGSSLYGTHARTKTFFQPSGSSDVVLAVRLRLASVRRGVVYGIYLYDCAEPPASCADDHDELDIELLSNFLQSGSAYKVQLNRYAAEPLGIGHGPIVPLPSGFDPLAFHEWKIRWGLTRIIYFLDAIPLFSTTSVVPQRAMHADMVAWGPSTDWPDAYDASLAPASEASANQRLVADVDRFSVTAAPSSFEDDPLTAGSTPIRSAHVRELRQRIDALRARLGLSSFAWTDSALSAGVSAILAQHIIEMRDALRQAYVAAGLPPPVYSRANIAVDSAIMTTDIAELRAAVIGLE